MKLLTIILYIVGIYFLFLSFSTIWATHQSRERTQCYKEALKNKQYDKDCGNPSELEMYIRKGKL